MMEVRALLVERKRGDGDVASLRTRGCDERNDSVLENRTVYTAEDGEGEILEHF